MKTHTLICAIIALALNIDVDPEKIKPPRGGRTCYIERDKGGGRPKLNKDKKTLKPPIHRVYVFFKDRGNSSTEYKV
ncbi:hypothetical protein BWK63_13145 [Flavobacterium covae]|uniref:Uncharacterized protein n=2 Tax=Flavobacterium TaxID=237 RepID=A0ABW8PKD1_9FLAO|nr:MULTISPECIES: hypothetical protein [Flavobacterium]OWP80036.1 hypothetical protein BWK63_13145 [Flavobacterium covae]